MSALDAGKVGLIVFLAAVVQTSILNAVEVAGGLGGVLVDLRDVPLRLPERADRRRELLDGWQTAAMRDGAARA